MGALNKDAFFSHLGSLAEEIVHIEGMGDVLVREMSGESRAKVLEVLAPAAAGGKAEIVAYQRMLLQLGLADPDSPADDRRPLLDVADAAKVLKTLGAAKVERLLAAVERVSGLGGGSARSAEAAVQSAEGNSESTPSSSSTSG